MPQGEGTPGDFMLSIDWEDFGQLYRKYLYGDVVPPADDIDRQTNVILEMLDRSGVKATFFVLGMLAKYRPDLVKRIQEGGHEIALHGMWHEAMFTLDPGKARADLEDSHKLVSDIVGEPVLGYRAPFFSVVQSNLFVLEILADIGMEYDSSIFPVKLPRYGIAGFDRADKLYKVGDGKEIVELPLTVHTWANKEWPVSGGGYIRLLPKALIKRIYRSMEAGGNGGMIYMHPYEFDTRTLDVARNFPDDKTRKNGKIRYLNFRWNLFRQSIREKISYLLENYNFSTCLTKARHVRQHGNGSIILG